VPGGLDRPGDHDGNTDLSVGPSLSRWVLTTVDQPATSVIGLIPSSLVAGAQFARGRIPRCWSQVHILNGHFQARDY